MGRYIALQPLTLGGGVVRTPGEEVPEAATWDSVDLWISAGALWYQPDIGEAYGGPWPLTPVTTVGVPEGLEAFTRATSSPWRSGSPTLSRRWL